MQWLMDGASDLGPTNTNINFLSNRMPEKVPGSMIKFYEDRLTYLFRAADAQLASTPYLAGRELTLADLAIYTVYAARKALLDAVGLKNVTAWGDRLAQRPGVQKGMRLENRPYARPAAARAITRTAVPTVICAPVCAACGHGRNT